MEKHLLNYFLGNLGKPETIALFKKLKNDDKLKADYIRLRNTSALAHLSRHSINKAEGKRSFRNFSRRLRKQGQHETMRLLWRYAAVAAVFIALTFFATSRYYEYSIHGIADMNTLYVPAGQRARLLLQDGTEVWLNANSTLQYPARFSGGKREVTITGEAFFNVAGNPEKPFIVSSQNVEIEVLGTQFNVHSYPGSNYIQADLVEGKLKVYTKEFPEEAVILHPNERVMIKSDKMYVDSEIDFNHFLWKDGIYSFEDENLSAIIEKLELYFDVKIVVQDPEIVNMVYTGKFRQRDGIDEIIGIIQKIQKFNVYKDTKNNVIVLTK